LLQAIAADGVIPFINPFSVTNLKGEPRRALYLTATIAEAGVLLANVDYIAPIITMCVLVPRVRNVVTIKIDSCTIFIDHQCFDNTTPCPKKGCQQTHGGNFVKSQPR